MPPPHCYPPDAAPQHAFMQGATIVLSNSLYMYLTISFIEMARALLPLFTMVALYLAKVWEGALRPRPWCAHALAALAQRAALACRPGAPLLLTTLPGQGTTARAPPASTSHVTAPRTHPQLESPTPQLVRAVILTAIGCAISAYGEVCAGRVWQLRVWQQGGVVITARRPAS